MDEARSAGTVREDQVLGVLETGDEAEGFIRVDLGPASAVDAAHVPSMGVASSNR